MLKVAAARNGRRKSGVEPPHSKVPREITPDGRSGQTPFVGCLVNHNRHPSPLFFISVDSKGR
jgi:hypothetical protein